MSTLDPVAVHADDLLLDVLGSGQDWPADEPLTDVLATWRDDVDSAPIPAAPKHAAEPPRLEWLGSVVAQILDPVLSWWPASRQQWTDVATVACDLLEEVAGAFVVALAALTALGFLALAVLTVAAIGSPEVAVAAAGLAGFAVFMAWRLKIAGRQLDAIRSSMDDLLDGEGSR